MVKRQNTSPAVMQQRGTGKNSLDDFPTPPWATRALFHMFDAYGIANSFGSVWEPTANRGFMVRPMKERFKTVHASDIADYGGGYPIDDFLFPNFATVGVYDWIITNPPFVMAKEFTLTAIERAKYGVAILARSAFAEGQERYNELFLPHPPAYEMQFVQRVPMVQSRCDRDATTATCYSWFVWLLHWNGPTFKVWIPPNRQKWEKVGDYGEIAAT